MRVEIIKTSQLGENEINRWRELQNSNPALIDPFMNVEWAQIVASERADAKTAIIEDAGQIIGFLSLQKCDAFTMMGLGNPICGTDGIICAPDAEIDFSLLPKAFGVDRLDFLQLPIASKQNNAAAKNQFSSMGSNVKSWNEHIAGLSKKKSSHLRNLDKLHKKLNQEYQNVEFKHFSKDKAGFNAMLDWKRLQYVATGQRDILSVPWIRNVHEKVHDYNSEYFSGEMFVLSADSKVISSLFCIRSKNILHTWMISYDKVFSKFSPGNLIWFDMMTSALNHGVDFIDFGTGDYDYKKFYSNELRDLASGFIANPSLSGAIRGAMFNARNVIEKMENKKIAELPGKIMRRIDRNRAIKYT